MRFPAKKYKRPTIHLTALIDIVFLLLIFFLLASSFVDQQGIQILIPEVSSESKDLLPDITVQIDQDGIFYYNGIDIGDQALYYKLEERFKASKVHRLAIRADRRVEYGKIVQVIDIAKSAGAKDFLLVNQQSLQE